MKRLTPVTPLYVDVDDDVDVVITVVVLVIFVVVVANDHPEDLVSCQ